MTWHEHREISPGVPDLSFVMHGMNPRGYETGWIELKAIRQPSSLEFRFKVEPSQHQWIEDHWKKCPVLFLVAVGEELVYLIPGAHHGTLADSMTRTDLIRVSIGCWPRKNFAKLLAKELRNITARI